MTDTDAHCVICGAKVQGVAGYKLKALCEACSRNAEGWRKLNEL